MLQDAEGRLQWEMPNGPTEPTRVSLVADDDRWHGYIFRLSYAGGEITDLEITRNGDAAPLSAQLLQRVPLGALDRAARRCVEDFLEVWERPEELQVLYPDPLDWLDAVADTNPGRENDKRLAELCKRYLDLRGESDWRETLGVEFGYQSTSVQTIIGRARKRRFLTKVPRGQNGGQLTPKALRLLAPPSMQSAWDQATDERRAAALQREERRAEREADLLDQLRAGTIDKKTYGTRSLALDAALVGWAPRDLYPDEPNLAEIEREYELIKDDLKEQS